jgi:magnesium chelatase family protein
MNPCPCGYFNHPSKDCVCSPGVVQKYLNKISGPLLDRIDIHIEVTPVDFEQINDHGRSGESSEDIKQRVVKAREIQQDRFNEQTGVYSNAQMESNLLRKHCSIDQQGSLLLKSAMNKLNLSARAYDRILKVSRTIADLAGSSSISFEHLAEAIQYRSLDRETWGT